MQIDIDFTPQKATITTELPQDLKELLYEFLAFRSEGYFFSPKYQSGVWDGYSRLFNPNAQTFNSGLLPHVAQFLASTGDTVNVSGKPASTTFSPAVCDLFTSQKDPLTLRPYQLECANAICKDRFGIVRVPPRGGKTAISAAVFASEAKFPSVFFCRSIDLAHQAQRVFQRLMPGLTIGLVGDGECEIGDITVITIQSAFSAFNRKFEDKRTKDERPVDQKNDVRKVIRDARVVFYDEFHHALSKTSSYILGKCINTTIMVGLSATPFSGDAEDIVIESICGPVLFDISYSELIRLGYLLRPSITLFKLPKIVLDSNYQSVYKQAVIENEFLNTLVKRVVREITAKGQSVVIQTEFKNHTRAIGKLLNAPILYGDDDTPKRDYEKERLATKKNLVLVSTLYEEGIDLPSLDITINLAGNIGDITTLQRMRSMTISDGKETCGVIDFIHQCKYLSKHSRARKRCYEAEPEFLVRTINATEYMEGTATYEDASVKGV